MLQATYSAPKTFCIFTACPAEAAANGSRPPPVMGTGPHCCSGSAEIGALMIRKWLWGIPQYRYNKGAIRRSIGNCFQSFGLRFRG